MPVPDIDAIRYDPHLRATDFFRPRAHPQQGQYIEVPPPIRVSVGGIRAELDEDE
jgi:hypothetical protein